MEGDLRNTVSALTSGISIHALRVEGDDQQQQPFAIVGYFYPRPPGGGRLLFFMVRVDIFGFLSTPSGWRATSTYSSNLLQSPFLSTPSGWRATIKINPLTGHVMISIHALRVEGDAGAFAVAVQPSISIHALRVEGDLVHSHHASIDNQISIHALRVEGDHRGRPLHCHLPISIHALRVEGDVRAS